MAPFTISISNKSGRKQSYAIFAEEPLVKHNGASGLKITRRIITSVHHVASDEGQAIFTLSKDWYATCGIYDVDSRTVAQDGNLKKVGSGTEVVDLRRVKLGPVDHAGGRMVVPGTFLEIECANGTPSFVSESAIRLPIPDVEANCFAIRTRDDFRPQEARANKFVVGFTSARRQNIGSYASFSPSPSTIYQIQPLNTLYVTVGDFNVGDLTKPNLNLEASTCRVDFDKLETDQVDLLHDNRGVLNILTVQPTEEQMIVNNSAMKVFRRPLAKIDAASATPTTSDTETDF